MGKRIGTVVLRRAGRALVALQTGIHAIDPTTGRLTRLADPVPDQYLRFNDGKCDPAGRFWVGTFDMMQRLHAGTLYRFDPDGGTHVMLRRITNSNGIAWSLDCTTMYYIDMPTLVVQAFDYDHVTGHIANLRVVIRIPEGSGGPDGMTIDAEDQLWVALWGRVVYTVTTLAPGHCCRSLRCPRRSLRRALSAGRGSNPVYHHGAGRPHAAASGRVSAQRRHFYGAAGRTGLFFWKVA